ncbi:MAG: SH3 domain-containing protein [Chloroflexota bacterium]
MKHVIVLVLLATLALPIIAQDETPEGPVDTEDVLCTVEAEAANTVRVRVGPGTNRTAITFLPAGEAITVLGQAEANDESAWFQVEKSQAAPGSAILEAWIRADAEGLIITGDCETVEDTFAPPIIPIIPSITELETDNTGAETDTEGVTSLDSETFTEDGVSVAVTELESNSSYFQQSNWGVHRLQEMLDYFPGNMQARRSLRDRYQFSRINQTTYEAYVGRGYFEYIRFVDPQTALRFTTRYPERGWELHAVYVQPEFDPEG